MKNNLPKISTAKRICIVCEGNEEFLYIKRLQKLNVFSNSYSIKPINAGGLTKIFKHYTTIAKSDSFDIVIIFCDTDNAPYEEFIKLQTQIKDYYGKNKINDLPTIVFFGNPCSMQIILSHFENVNLKSRLKSANAPLIQKLTSVKDYKAKENEINSIMNKINAINYEKMKNNISALSTNPNTTPSTNILYLFQNLESDKTKWINDINKKL